MQACNWLLAIRRSLIAGKGDKVFISTTGIGLVERPVNISAGRARPGDKIILSGYIGDHGMAILSQRENLEFEGAIESDCAALHNLVADMIDVTDDIHCLRDPTRGGVATVLYEIAATSPGLECCCAKLKSQCAIACAALANFSAWTRSMWRMKES